MTIDDDKVTIKHNSSSPIKLLKTLMIFTEFLKGDDDDDKMVVEDDLPDWLQEVSGDEALSAEVPPPTPEPVAEAPPAPPPNVRFPDVPSTSRIVAALVIVMTAVDVFIFLMSII